MEEQAGKELEGEKNDWTTERLGDLAKRQEQSSDAETRRRGDTEKRPTRRPFDAFHPSTRLRTDGLLPSTSSGQAGQAERLGEKARTIVGRGDTETRGHGEKADQATLRQAQGRLSDLAKRQNLKLI